MYQPRRDGIRRMIREAFAIVSFIFIETRLALRLIYRCALEYYLANGFIYIELGDAEELWENDNFDQIYITHTPVYELLAKFHDPDPEKTRYLKVWGNHDLYWQDNAAVYQSLFPGIQIYEGLILNDNILMIHGHQADPKCTGEVATVSKFFVHNFWAGFQPLFIIKICRRNLDQILSCCLP